MASSLSFSTFENYENINTKSTSKRKNKTIKKRTKKVEKFLNGLASMNDDSSDLADFKPEVDDFPPQPELTKQPDPVKENSQIDMEDDPVTPEGFSTIDQNEAANLNYQNYYNTYVPYYNTPTNNANLHGSKDELMKKLNYLIHMMEENKDEKTQNVTEELVLYMFLGVFTIFVVDSFARAGKYTR